MLYISTTDGSRDTRDFCSFYRKSGFFSASVVVMRVNEANWSRRVRRNVRSLSCARTNCFWTSKTPKTHTSSSLLSFLVWSSHRGIHHHIELAFFRMPQWRDACALAISASGSTEWVTSPSISVYNPRLDLTVGNVWDRLHSSHFPHCLGRGITVHRTILYYRPLQFVRA